MFSRIERLLIALLFALLAAGITLMASASTGKQPSAPGAISQLCGLPHRVPDYLDERPTWSCC